MTALRATIHSSHSTLADAEYLIHYVHALPAGVKTRLLSGTDVQSRWSLVTALPRGSVSVLSEGGCLDFDRVREALMARRPGSAISPLSPFCVP